MERIYKKTYTTPSAEKIEFNYAEQVVAASSCAVHKEYYDSNPGPECHYFEEPQMT